MSSEPGPVREANGVRATANQRPPATRNVPFHEQRARSRRRSRSEWGASDRESALTTDTQPFRPRMPHKEVVCEQRAAQGVVRELPVADRARRLRRELTQERAYEGGLAFVKALGVKGFLERK